jgi:hypothetical protein
LPTKEKHNIEKITNIFSTQITQHSHQTQELSNTKFEPLENNNLFAHIEEISYTKNMNLDHYLEYTSLKLYITQYFEGLEVEDYNYKSFSFHINKHLDKIQIISKHNIEERLFMNFDIEKKSFNTHTLFTILNIIEQTYNREINNPL